MTGASENRVRVLVVDDSRTQRLLLVHILESDPTIQVVGDVDSGQKALDFLARQRPDLVLVDIHMPGLDGFELTRQIMASHPVPIVICSSSYDPSNVELSLRSLQAGALACVEKPVGPGHKNFKANTARLLQAVRLMAAVRVVKRRPLIARPPPQSGAGDRRVKLIGIGASTGGPAALHSILTGLQADFPLPILVVQHILPGFLPGMASWLTKAGSLPVELALDGIPPRPGHVYLAPDDRHLGIRADGCLELSDAPAEKGLRPAVGYLFRSLARELGAGAVGVILSGMGRDGAAELKLLRKRGALTIAQDQASAAVNGMPGEAVILGAAEQILAPAQIVEVLRNLKPACA